MDIKTLSIDLETRSGADISKAGLYRYAEDPERLGCTVTLKILNSTSFSLVFQ